jgi:perosamine synthetase
MSESETKQEYIPLCVPHIRGNEWAYVKECLDSEWVSSVGLFVDRFEAEFARYVGSDRAVACASGTAALHVALLLAGVKPRDLVLAPTLTFVATVNAIRYCGADPLFFDADEHYNIAAPQVAAFLQEDTLKKNGALYHRKSGRHISTLLLTHVFGNAVDLEPLLSLCEEFGLPLVEDATESLGTRYLPSSGSRTGGRHTGTLGLFGCFSFNGNKIITTGGGGMLVTDDEALARKARYLTTQAKDDEVRFIHNEIGYNYRMTNVQAAIGVAQLEKIDDYKRKKKVFYDRYVDGLAGVKGLAIGRLPTYADNNCWMPALQVDSAAYGEDREALMARLERASIQTRPVWMLNHRQRAFVDCERMGIVNAESLLAITLNIPCSIGMAEAQQDRVIRELRRGR